MSNRPDILKKILNRKAEEIAERSSQLSMGAVIDLAASSGRSWTCPPAPCSLRTLRRIPSRTSQGR